MADFAVFDPATSKSTALAPLQTARGNAQVSAHPREVEFFAWKTASGNRCLC